MKKIAFIAILILFGRIAVSQTLEFYEDTVTFSNEVLKFNNSLPCSEKYDIGHRPEISLLREGEKEKNNQYGNTWARSLRFRAYFHDDCQYNFGGDHNQKDWNKLMDIANVPNTDYTSCRLGWRWDTLNNVMNLGLYGHIKHDTGSKFEAGREFLYLASVNTSEWFDSELILASGGMGVVVNDVGSYFKREDIFDEGSVKTSFLRSAYFGGQECPPDKMTIDIQKIYGDYKTNWHDGACEKTFSRSYFYDYDDLVINAARSITLSEEVYRGQYSQGNLDDGKIPANYNVGDERPWSAEVEGGRFVVVKTGSKLILNAGQRIVLKDGFHAEAGSTFTARIDPTLACAPFELESPNRPNNIISYETFGEEGPKGGNGGNGGNNTLPNNNNTITPNNIENIKFSVYPNPSKGEFNISANLIHSVVVLDVLGNEVVNIQNLEKAQFQLNLSPYSKGIYVLKVFTSEGINIKRLVLE